MWGRASGQDRCHSLPCGKPHSGSRASHVPELWPSVGSHPLLQAQAMVLGDGGGQGPAVPDSPLLLAGTRIIYDRKFLLECKNSPVARTPPCCLPQIPGVTSLAQASLVKLEELKERNESEEAMPGEQPRCAAPAYALPATGGDPSSAPVLAPAHFACMILPRQPHPNPVPVSLCTLADQDQFEMDI